jgi:Asp-tRNA(Asn)/Glu-tRNA(Gln) amidotransferase A subunit family amidase
MSGIDAAALAAAEVALGVTYTAQERAMLAGSFDGHLAAVAARRAVIPPNHIPPACVFDPRPTGFVMPAAPAPATPLDADPGPVPGDDADIAFAPAARLSAWLRRGGLTSRRLTEIYLDRIARIAPGLECFVTVTPDRARAQADAADAALAAGRWLGPLHGLPYGLKDLFDTAGVPTTWGAEPYADRTPDADARVVTLLREAGAVLLGKTTLGALAYGDVWHGGITRNPWNPAEGSSGSSAGSAAATAAGLCAFSIGTETLGSIVSPSQRCGTTGLRPTFGRVSRAGAMALCWSLDKVGPICRAVEDCALVLGVLNGPDPDDRGAIAAPFAYDPALELTGARIGYLPEAYDDAAATPVDRAALEAARGLGLTVTPVRLPALPYDSLTLALFAEAAAAFEDLTLTGADDTLTRQDPGAWPNAWRRSRFLSAVDLVQLDRLRFLTMQALDGLFREVDFLIGPFSTGPMLVASNFTGHPCLHLRAGFMDTPARAMTSMAAGRLTPGAPNGETPRRVPYGVSLWAGLFQEPRLLRLGAMLEAALDVAAERPPLD